MHKRRIVMLIALITVLTVILLSACKNTVTYERTYRQNDGNFSVHYFDVGQGDSAFIYLPDGKTVLIDTGNGSSENNAYILEFLSRFSVDKIDYLVLTHPDSDHIGGAESIINNVGVETAYLPYAVEKENFPKLKSAFDLLGDKNTKIKTSATYEHIKGEDYSVAFLLPYPPELSYSSYAKLNGKYPSESDINNVSPIIYVEYKGVKFVFTGDADSSQEKILLDDEKVICGFFNKLGITVNFDNIDFLKLAHHGSEDSSSENFIKRITPKNAVISVSGTNVYGLPASKTLDRLVNFSPNCKLYRTDVFGTISVIVNSSGDYQVVTD